MADEIARAGATSGLAGKQDVETHELTKSQLHIQDRDKGFAHARAMDPEHRARVEKSMKRKLDARCGLFVLIYIMNYLDRNNIAAAVCHHQAFDAAPELT
jgi:hypothetical protein